ncbi:MAG: hypothetical protein V4572_12135 [Bacteroidota bacterium]
MNLEKKIGLAFTILAGVSTVGVILFNKDDNTLPTNNTKNNNTYNIKGDFVNRDKISNVYIDTVKRKDKSPNENINKKKDNTLVSNKKVDVLVEKPSEKPVENNNDKPVVNNGIINSGVNYGTQTVNNNNYNGREAPRQITQTDVDNIKKYIPLDYKISILYCTNTQESLDFSNQIYRVLKEIGYTIYETKGAGMIGDGYQNNPGLKFRLNKEDKNKTAKITIKEQK